MNNTKKKLFSATAVMLMSVSTVGGVATGLAEELGDNQADVEQVQEVGDVGEPVAEGEVEEVNETEETGVGTEEVEVIEEEVVGENIKVNVAANTTEDVWGPEDRGDRGAYRIFYKDLNNVAGTQEFTDVDELVEGTHRIHLKNKFPTPEGSKGFIIVDGDGEVGATYFDVVIEKDKVTEYNITVDLWENVYGEGEKPETPEPEVPEVPEEPEEPEAPKPEEPEIPEDEKVEVTVEIRHIGLKYAEDDIFHEGEPTERVILGTDDPIKGKQGETFTYRSKEFEGYTPKISKNVEQSATFDYRDTVIEVLYDEELDLDEEEVDPEEEEAEIKTATKAVETAEELETQTAVDTAQELVNGLADGEDKVSLQGRLDAVQDIIDAKEEELLADATEAVEKAEELETQTALDTAQERVNMLADGEDKDDLQGRLDVVQDIIDAKEEEELLADATEAVEKAEESKNQVDVDTAQERVDMLADGEDKISLQGRLDDVQDIIDAKEEELEEVVTVGRDNPREETRQDGEYKQTGAQVLWGSVIVGVSMLATGLGFNKKKK